MVPNPPTVATSGFTASYTDPRSGAVYPDAWLQISDIDYVPNSSCHVLVNVFVDETAYQDGMSPVSTDIVPSVLFDSEDWNTYFDVSVLGQADHDIVAQSLAFAQAKV